MKQTNTCELILMVLRKERAAYPEQNTLHLENVENLSIVSDSITPKKTQNGREEDSQECFHILFNENEANKSIIAN